MQKSLKVLFHQYIVPHRLLSAVTYFLMHTRYFPMRNRFMAFMARRHSVKIDEARYPDYTDRTIHPNINSFFVRALKDGARPIADGVDQICSPADGTVSQAGIINDTKIFQAKGHSFSLVELLGGSEARAEPFKNGHFATIYLSPSDYHRVHIPQTGKLREMVHIPGKLLSVAPFMIDGVPDLFARNERVATLFDTDIGPMAVVLVGAINVGSIETVWAGEITPPRGLKVTDTHYDDSDAITLAKGAELGRFNMGSTVIILFAENKIQWTDNMQQDSKVRMGELIATVKSIN